MHKILTTLQNGTLIQIPGFLDTHQADQLFTRLTDDVAWRQDKIRLFGKEHFIPRRQAFQGNTGLSYTYSGLQLAASHWHPDIASLLPTLNDLADTEFNCALLNLYRDGQDCMGWHSDDEPELGTNPVIASLSLGARRRFRLRHKTDRSLAPINLELGHGDVLIMAGATQHFWQHAVPRTTRVQTPRINLTFRRITRSTL